MSDKLKSQILIWVCIVLLVIILIIDYAPAQTILVSEGSMFTKGVYYDHNGMLDFIYSRPGLNPDDPTDQWDRWVDEGYLGRRGQWYYIRFPEYEYWDRKVICHVLNDTTLKWFAGKKNFGWDRNDKVDPIEVHYREYRFRVKDGNLVEKQKGILLKNNSNGQQDLKDIVYNGLKGVTVAFENRVKPKERIK